MSMRSHVFQICGFVLVCSLSAIVHSPTAAAQQIAFTPSGFSLSVPEGYGIRAFREQPGSDTSTLWVDIKDLKYVHCNISFQKVRQPAPKISRPANPQTPEVNSLVFVPFVIVGDLDDVLSTEDAGINGIRGTATVSDKRFSIPRPTSFGKLRELKVVLKNENWTAKLDCATEDGDFEKRRQDFEIIARGISFPR
jgi:hypothetical protein